MNELLGCVEYRVDRGSLHKGPPEQKIFGQIEVVNYKQDGMDYGKLVGRSNVEFDLSRTRWFNKMCLTSYHPKGCRMAECAALLEAQLVWFEY